MTRKEFKDVKGIAKEMKASGQSEILTPTPIAVAGPKVTIAQPIAQVQNVPYAVVVQQKGKEVKQAPTQRKSTRVEKAKPVESLKKQTKKTTSGPRKKRKTLQISSSESEEET